MVANGNVEELKRHVSSAYTMMGLPHPAISTAMTDGVASSSNFNSNDSTVQVSVTL
jgi:hypothetical protein